RMILPGIQALFGFQMVAVFNSTFAEKLSSHEQKLHVVAIIFVIIAIGLLMAPAALHREAEPQVASERFLMVASRLMLAAMLPLSIAISLDAYIVARLAWHTLGIPVAIAGSSFVLFAVLWFVFPRWYRSALAA